MDKNTRTVVIWICSAITAIAFGWYAFLAAYPSSKLLINLKIEFGP